MSSSSGEEEDRSMIYQQREEVKASPTKQTAKVRNEGEYMQHRADKLRKRRGFQAGSRAKHEKMPFEQLEHQILHLQNKLAAYDAVQATLKIKQAKLQMDLNQLEVFDILMSDVTLDLLDNLHSKQLL